MGGQLRWTLGLMVIATGLIGCSRPPEGIARNIIGIDRVFATNRIYGSALSLNGEEPSKLVRAVSCAKRSDGSTQPEIALTSRLEFYRGTNLLDAIDFCNRVFWADEW